MIKFLPHIVFFAQLFTTVSGNSASSILDAEADHYIQKLPKDQPLPQVISRRALKCERLYKSECDPENSSDCVKEEICPWTNSQHHPVCMAVWKNDTATGNLTAILKGCWQHDDLQKCDPSVCYLPEQPDGNGMLFCCCKKAFCNGDPTLRPAATMDASSDGSHKPTADTKLKVTIPKDALVLMLAVLGGLMAVMVLGLIAFFVYCRMSGKLKKCKKAKQPILHLNTEHLSLLTDLEQLGKQPASYPICGTAAPLRNILHLELAARGRFGIVYRGEYNHAAVAVKVFPETEEDSWISEQEIYALPLMKSHDNILRYIGAEQRVNEFWLITEFQELGSLSDFLKDHILNQEQALHILTSMLCGLAFLHEERIGSEGTTKPGIVHRDFKSRNVLLKPDYTACISDFGLALKCENGRIAADSEVGSQSQVGTHRYMAPEVLDGAMEFSAFAFRQIDVYAAALVMWEVLTRTSLGPDDLIMEPYCLPYEAEVGVRPNLQQMQNLICARKFRPVIRRELWDDEKCALLCTSMCEMWDFEPEGRLTCRCAYERVRILSQPKP